jgi:hypothetical protein
MKDLSKCCKAEVWVGGAGSTRYYVCNNCGNPCDLYCEEDLKLCHACNTMKHIRNGTICQGCVVEMSKEDTGTIKLYTQERLDDACTLYQKEPLK